jgi:Cu+-exporting ATPase
MTCASCAARIEKRLNRLDGVSATVNFVIAIVVVWLTLPYIRAYSPIAGGRR